MPDSPSQTQPDPVPVPFEPEREVRFAVVMYGGVSLAIYINGVAQELLNMVRATAPDPASNETKALLYKSDDLKGSTGVYRKLGQHLRERKKLRVDSEGKPAKQTSDPIRTRFVVDIISGTSAGGINGVFLAKALAKNQTMRGLKDLWLSEGDLAKLLNDPLSVADLRESGFSVQQPRQSLLNSQRMYRKLLEALAQMDPDASKNQSSVYDGLEKEREALKAKGEQSASPEQEALIAKAKPVPSPLVNELDLFITTTDIEGIPLPIALSDMVVFERRHKNVFHFRHELTNQRDDFRARNDPFLAFAARCTSSFPFAFEPMRLCDINDVTSTYRRYAGATDYVTEWDHFFSDYLRHALYDLDKQARGSVPEGELEHGPDAATKELRDAFSTRAFGDGGYLDNKPFSHATSMLMRRQSDYLVDRKMIYVEPSPEHPELMPKRRVTPDFVENVRAAVLELPRQETIREDLDSLDERNRMVQRVASFAREVDADVAFDKKPPLPHEFGEVGLGEMIEHYGSSYGAYHRLKVGDITSYLAEFVTRAKGHDPSSDAGTAIRALVSAWRAENYVPLKPKSDGTSGKTALKTENEFLLKFDIRFRLRRIIFLIRRANELSQLDPDDMTDQAKRLLHASLQHIRDDAAIDRTILERIDNWLEPPDQPPTGKSLADITASRDEAAAWLDGFGREMQRLKKKYLAPMLVKARAKEEQLVRSGADGPLADSLKGMDIQWSEMKRILDTHGSRRLARAKKSLVDHSTALQAVADAIEKELDDKQSSDLRSALASEETSSSGPGSNGADDRDKYAAQGRLAAQLCLVNYRENFIRYDMVTYPVQYGTGATEANVVEVFRVSPEDATSLIGERRPGENRRKLAGTAIMSFGAFLDRGWRKNDMLWGRLDGAERLITALLPAEDPTDDVIRDNLIKEAQMAILEEEVRSGDLESIKRLLSNALAKYEPSSTHDRNLREVVEGLIDKKNLPEAVASALRQCLSDPDGLWSYYKENFEVNRNLEPENALRLISRATNVTGKMLEGLADKYGSDRGRRTAVWIARLGSVFWNLIAVAVPGSLGNLFVRHWLALLYLFCAVMIAGGIFINQGVKNFGWQALGLTAALHLTIFLLGDFISSKWKALRIMGGLAIAGLIALVACGVVYIANLPIFKPESAKQLDQLEHFVTFGVVTLLLLFIGAMEVRRFIRSFLAAPDTGIDYKMLWWRTGFMALFLGVLLLFSLFAPPGSPGMFEFARNHATASQLAQGDGVVASLRYQLLADYLFLISYAAAFAGYCGAAARAFWQRQAIIAENSRAKHEQALEQPATLSGTDGAPAITRHWKPSVFLRTLRWVALAGFAFAGAQWLAGLADAAENTGLLLFLNHRETASATGLTIVSYCAALKFVLVALGSLYSTVGFVVGRFLNRGGNSLLVFAAISFVTFLFCACALFRHVF